MKDYPQTKYSFIDLVEIVAKLRSSSGCLWDREQTHESIKENLIEEAYEVVEVIDEGDFSRFKEELGDLLLQIVFHAQMASEEGRFTIDEVTTNIVDKLIRRHPHIFGEKKVSSSKEILKHWEEIKKEEKRGESTLNEVPTFLPALYFAYKLQSVAARVGFDWQEKKGVFEKLIEEIEELKKASELKEGAEEEIGDILFSLVNLARHLEISAEGALRKACRKFIERFKYMEELAKKQGKDFKEMPLQEKDKLWERAKREEE
ncbi:MAG: nucleoside triphosphate pyrophosphohydrolase [Candidatus Subteraquimicrobiales bacterium]|nr:nucleoside triphosphate pyrophosphohydrolase [Candidatus Subteraquimicrobiales bacterium]